MSDTNLNEENIRFDASVINMLTKMGTMGDRQEYTMPGKLQRWSQQTLEDLARIKVLNNVATALPDAAIRRGWDLTLGSEGDNDLIELFNEEHERLEVPEMFNEAQFEANIYGGAAIVIVCDDGKPAYEPIDIKNLKSIISLEVLDRYKIEPDLAFTGINPLKPERYRLILPEYIKKDLSKVIDKNPRYLVHESRIIRFDAHGIRSTPEMLRQNQGWGESLLSVLWEDYKDWKSSLKALGAMVQDCSIFTHKIKNFSQMIKQKEEHLLQARLTMLRMMVSVFGGIAIDSENEDVSFPSRSFAGVDQISSQQRDAFIGASGIPHDRLFGESPSGLGATGESEEKNWASTVSDFQTSRWSRKLKKLFKLIFQSKEGPTKGKIPKGWGIEFADLILMSEADKASLRSTMASSDSTYLNSGVLLPEEIRESRFGKSKYSIETTLDDALFKKKQKESEQQNQFGGFPDFGGEQLPPEEVPPEEVPPEEVPPEEVPPEEVPPEEVPPEAIQQDSWDYRADAVDISTLEQKDGKVFYRGRWWKPNDPMPSDRQGKKRMVLAKEGNQVALVHYGAKGYDHNYSPEAKRSFLARMKEVRTKDGKPAYKDKFSPAYWAIKDLWNPSEPADGSAKYDVMGVGGFAGELNAGTPRTKRVVNWNGIGIGITHEPGDVRFPMAQPMKCGYGHVRGSYGQAPDKKAFDVYVGDNLSAANGYKVRQIDPTTGFYDEDKYFIGFKSPAEVREMFTYHAGVHRFGGIEPLKPDELGVYRQDNCGCSVPEIDNGTQVLSGDRKIKVVNDENILIAIQSTFPEAVLALGDWMVTAEGNIGGEFFTDYGIYKFGVKRGINDVVTYRWNRDIRNDSRVNERKGYHWVEDKRVKDGGYWRKNPGKSTSLQSPDKQNKPGDKKSTSNGAGIGLAIAGGVTALGIAGGVTALALASRGGSGSSGNANPPNPEVEKTKSKAEQEARARSEQAAKVKAEQERIKQEQEAKVKAEQERIKQEQEAKAKAKDEKFRISKEYDESLSNAKKIANEIQNTESIEELDSNTRKKYNQHLLNAISHLNNQDKSQDVVKEEVNSLKEIIDTPLYTKDDTGVGVQKAVKEAFNSLYENVFPKKSKSNAYELENLNSYSRKVFNAKYIKGASSKDIDDLGSWQKMFDEHPVFIEALSSSKEADSKRYAGAVIYLAKENPELFRGLRDTQGQLQAGAIVKKANDALFVQYLGTAPHNLIRQHPDKASGSGVFMMEKLIKESMDSGYNGALRLGGQSGTSSEFYRKVGFKGDNLSPENAKIFLKKIENARKELGI